MQVKKQQLELDMEQWMSSASGKEFVKAVYCHPAYLTYMHIMQNARLDEAQAGIKIARRNIKFEKYQITSDMQMTPPLWQKVKRN